MLGNRRWSSGADKRQSNGGSPVRRIDWEQCTILPAASVAGRSTSADDIDAPEDILAALKSLFKRVVFDDSVPLYIAGLDGGLIHVNDGYRQFAGGQGGNGTGAPADSGQKVPPGLLAVIKEVQLTGRNVTLEEKVRAGDRIRYFRSRHFPITDSGGRTVAVGGTYVDCTGQVEGLAAANTAHKRFRDFARASSDWFWESDRDGRLTMLSDRLTALLARPVASLLGSALTEIGQFKAGDNGETVAGEAIANHRSFREQLFEMRAADGEIRLFYLSGVAVFDPANGEFDGYRGAGMDVTDRILAQREAADVRHNLENTLEELTNKNVQLDIASAAAANALKVKNEFLAAMSHELRTPLNAIIGFAEAMSMQVFGALNPQYKAYSKDILGAGRHLLGLINDVLDVAVLENNKISIDLEEVQLKDIIDAALNLVIMRANKKHLDTSEVKATGDWVVIADVRRAVQIFVNLFSNAVKFTPENGKIGLDISPVGADRVAVTVWDTGIGIPEEKHELVFEKFQQVTDHVYSRREEGTGLGLHISRHLARRMDGDITLESTPGEGSRFTVTLPVQAV